MTHVALVWIPSSGECPLVPPLGFNMMCPLEPSSEAFVHITIHTFVWEWNAIAWEWILACGG